MNKDSISLYFIPLTGQELITMSGICQIIQDNFSSIRTILLLTEHPRMKNKKEGYRQFFDEVIDLPYCDFTSSIRPISFIKGYQDCWHFVKAIRRCQISPKSIVFGGEMNQLVYILLWKEIGRRYSSKDVLLVSLNLYVDLNDFLVVDIKNTIFMNVYSVPLAGISMLAYMDRGTKTTIGRKLADIQDVTVFIEQEGRASDSTTFNNLPFPGKFVNFPDRPDMEKIRVKDNAILLLLDFTLPDYGYCEESSYSDTANKLAKEITLKNPECPLYIKLHPQDSDRNAERIHTPVHVIDKNYSAEEIYLLNKEKIRAVYSTASTAVLTASWFGITVFNCSELFKYQPSLLKIFNKYMYSGKKIRTIARYEDIKSLGPQDNFSTSCRNSETLNYMEFEKSRWINLIDKLIHMV
jgi:hypothetical protein